MYHTLSETGFPTTTSNGITNGLTPSFGHYNSYALTAVNGANHRSLSEEEQHLYNHHIIENFVESVREMNDVVLIPSKLKDLDTSSPTVALPSNKYVVLNDDLYSYYQMINVVKNDLFEPHSDESKKLSMLFSGPKRKISRQHRREQEQQNGHTRNMSSSNLAAQANNTPNGYQNGHDSSLVSSTTNGLISSNGNGIEQPPSPTGSLSLQPLTSEQLLGQNSKQLTVQFIHHLHSLYTILEHFTNAADFITERYQKEVEASI